MPVPPWFAELLQQEPRPWLSLSNHQISQLYTHYQLLERWNEKISLTSLAPGREMVIRHYCESLFLAVHLPIQAPLRIADFGSGAGFPGVPSAVVWPECEISLIESVQRKAVFLREAARHLKNVRVIAKRAEEIDIRFDLLVSRAVRPKEVLANMPRLASRVALLIGESALEEVRTQDLIAWQEPVRLPWGDRKFLLLGSVPRGTNP